MRPEFGIGVFACVMLFFTLGLLFSVPQGRTITLTEQQPPMVVHDRVYEPLPESRSVMIYGVGIYQNESDGELIGLNVSLVAGEGSLFIDSTFHVLGTDLQAAMLDAIGYAYEYTGFDFNGYDVRLSLESSAYEVGGASGGAALALAAIALAENKSVRHDVVISGELGPGGAIGPVDKLDAKIGAATHFNITSFLIPEQQCNTTNKNVPIQIICVGTVEEAIPYVLY